MDPEWGQLVTRWVEIGFGLLHSVVIMMMVFVAFNRIMHVVEMKAGVGEVQPSFRVMSRRLWCKHRDLARHKGRYGSPVTRCVNCAKDVNKGKPREQWW